MYISRGYNKLSKRSVKLTEKSNSISKEKSCFYSNIDTAAERIYNTKMGKAFRTEIKEK